MLLLIGHIVLRVYTEGNCLVIYKQLDFMSSDGLSYEKIENAD